MDFSPVIAAGGSVGLFGAVAALLFRLLILQSRRERQTDADIEDLKLENAWCNKRVSILIFACQQGGIAIPSEVWDGPPQVVSDTRRSGPGQRRGPARRRRGRSAGDEHDRDQA